MRFYKNNSNRLYTLIKPLRLKITLFFDTVQIFYDVNKKKKSEVLFELSYFELILRNIINGFVWFIDIFIKENDG